MKKELFLTVAVFFLFNYSSAQEQLSQEFNIQFKSAQEISKSFNLLSTTRTKDDRVTKIMVQCKVKVLDDLPFDSNGFSLVDTENKLRYRFVEYGGYLPITIIVSNERTRNIAKTPVLRDNGKPHPNAPETDASVYDSFDDYSIDGYQNIEIPINYGTKSNPKTTVVYKTPTPFKKFTATMHFMVMINLKPPNFELYYQDKKIEDFEIEFK